ncbi:MAG: outer membrane protein [Vicinamibacterales bacterium]
MTRAAVIGPLVKIGVVALLITVLAPGAAHAQGFVSPLIGYDFGGDSGCPEITACEDKNLNIGVSAGSLGSVLGSELEFAYARDFFGDIPGASSSVLTLMGNVMLAPQFGVVQPYALVGLGLIKTHVEFSAISVLESNNNHFGWDVGGGLMIFLGRNVGVRGDIRYFHAFQDLEVLGIGLGDTKLDFGRAAAGVVFRF